MNELLLRAEMFLFSSEKEIVAADVFAALEKSGVEKREAYALVLAAAMGLRVDEKAADREWVYNYLLPSIVMPDAGYFRRDPYYSSISLPEVRRGNVALTSAEYKPFQPFPCGDTFFDRHGRLRAPMGFFEESFSFPVIALDDTVWMSLCPNEIVTMRESVERACGNVLVYGLGLGYFAFMAARKDNVAAVHVVDCDEQIIQLFSNHILPQIPCRGKISVELSDAFVHAESGGFKMHETGRPYDSVFVDLWHNVSDGLPMYKRMKALQSAYANENQHFDFWIEPSLKCYLQPRDNGL